DRNAPYETQSRVHIDGLVAGEPLPGRRIRARAADRARRRVDQGTGPYAGHADGLREAGVRQGDDLRGRYRLAAARRRHAEAEAGLDEPAHERRSHRDRQAVGVAQGHGSAGNHGRRKSRPGRAVGAGQEGHAHRGTGTPVSRMAEPMPSPPPNAIYARITTRYATVTVVPSPKSWWTFPRLRPTRPAS